jgi:glycosyltransferase involved in cell wall biosynthesis
MDISVVIPAYNAAAQLEATLASAFAQRRRAAEVIVVDDGSTDGTAEIAAAAGASVIRQRNCGVAAARNAGVHAARSPWIAFLDADDRWLPAYIARVSDGVRACPDAAAIFTDYALDDPTAPCPSCFAADRWYRGLHGREIAQGVHRFAGCDVAAALVRSRAFVSTSALAVRRAAFLACGGFDESLRRAEDLELVLRLMVRATVAAVAEPLSIYRKHGANLTADEAACAADERRVWQMVIADPERYGHRLAAQLARALPARVRNDGIAALRGGRFADGVRDVNEAARLGDDAAAWLLPLARAANSRFGRVCYPGVRSTLRTFLRTRGHSP